VNPGEVWRLPDNSRRVVLSNATYNESRLDQVITAYIGQPSTTFQPFAVPTSAGTIYVDRMTMHPRHWLAEYVATIDERELIAVRRHLSFLLAE
jgi:hypothetical protein